jgi:hypothetical protein
VRSGGPGRPTAADTVACTHELGYARAMEEEEEKDPDNENEDEDASDDDEPRFHSYNLTFFAELSSLEFEDDLPEGSVVEVMRELSKRLAELADYYEAAGTSELFD